MIRGMPKRRLFPWQLIAGVIVGAVLLAQVLPAQPDVHAAEPVDLTLVLALDVSGSVDEDEFDLQRRGLAAAFRNPLVIDAIRRGPRRRIAVTAVQWAGFESQRVVVPWAVIGSASDAEKFADRLASMARIYPDGPTHLTGAIKFTTKLSLTAPFAGVRQVIDISGDGTNNVGLPPREARDAAVNLGITINGLVIQNASVGLVEYYRATVIGGRGAFTIAASDYEDYPRAILKKLLREIDVRLS